MTDTALAHITLKATGKFDRATSLVDAVNHWKSRAIDILRGDNGTN
jgi:hypothetical protein